MSSKKDLEIEVGEVLHASSVADAKHLMLKKSVTFLVGVISFLEAALPVPILTDPFLVAAILAQRLQAFRIVVVTTIASVAGGVFAYFSAMLFFDVLVQWLPPDLVSQFENMLSSNQSGVFMLTIMGAVTPIPYTLVAWAVAILHGSVFTFILASLLGRGARYALVGFVVYRFGEPALAILKRYIWYVTIASLILLLGYWLLN